MKHTLTVACFLFEPAWQAVFLQSALTAPLQTALTAWHGGTAPAFCRRFA